MYFNKIAKYIVVLILPFSFGCKNTVESIKIDANYFALNHSKNILDYRITPVDSIDKSGLMFSDQGAWFAYSLPNTEKSQGGFTGPFLMTQQNGVWISPSLTKLSLDGKSNNAQVESWKKNLILQNSYASHLEQTYQNDSLKIEQQLVFLSGHTALQRTKIINISNKEFPLNVKFSGEIFNLGITISKDENKLKLNSKLSNAIGYIHFVNEDVNINIKDSTSYFVNAEYYNLEPGKSKEYLVSQTFIYSEYSWEKELKTISNINFDSVLEAGKSEKENQLASLILHSKINFKDDKYANVLSKAHITLQNNWRIAAGELKHQGLFPSYHYEWFNGFWAWDSWKHAVGLSFYKTALAKDQIRAMFDYQNEDGFVVDCIYRDTTIEPFNYRDTKPPLSSWAVAEIFKKDSDIDFIREMYPKLKKYHEWWYNKRDHDKDGLCEYGSTDGTVLAAKWESGMDNAIRFDNSKILKNSDGAFSLNQESVDLNAYLYAEKLYLISLAEALEYKGDIEKLSSEAKVLKKAIQNQFYDSIDGWFYDTTLDGSSFIKGAGSEGWTALWAKAASQDQAENVKTKMMNPEKFFTKVPFQTMSKDHPKFDPLNGYWRGPNWLDQAYFGIIGLRNYGYNQEADSATIQIIKGANGILEKGVAIRENYHPITGEGREAQNFSWSAAHIIMMLTED